jgi:mandelate racemase
VSSCSRIRWSDLDAPPDERLAPGSTTTWNSVPSDRRAAGRPRKPFLAAARTGCYDVCHNTTRPQEVDAVADSSLTIRGLRVRTVDVPMSHPHRTAGGTITSSPLVLTDLLTDQGVVGSSYVFCYTAVALRPTALLLRGLEPLLVGEPVAPLELERLLAGRFRLLGAQGLAGMALAAIDMAAWDALARAHGLPLVRLLGAEPRPVRMYGSVGYDGADGSAREAAAWAERGVTGVKAKIGYPDVREDVAVIRAIRRAAGDEMALMVDYNSRSPR